MSAASPVHEIGPGEGYEIDSDEYDSQEEMDQLDPDEYDRLVEEAENGYTQDEMYEMTDKLKEQGLVTFLRNYLSSGKNGEIPKFRKLLLGFGVIPPLSLRHPSTPDRHLLPFVRLALARILRKRQKLPQYNSLADALRLLESAKNIIILSGAGISTSCGIPDFRSSGGLYAQLQEEGKYELDDPCQMFDIDYFREHPEVFYDFAKQIYPSNFVPSPCHRWIKVLEDKGKLLRNYTQNIDTLESLAGVQNVLQCHGSFKTASCLRCKTRVPGQTIEPYIMSKTIPYCEPCLLSRQDELNRIKALKEDRRKTKKGKGKAAGWGSGSQSEDEDEEDKWGGGEPGIIKPDITFFGQALDSEFDQCLWRDREKVDLLIIIGTSLKVAPVSEVLAHIPHSVPQIFINLTPVTHVKPDICLLGDADTIVTHLSQKLGWTIPPPAVASVDGTKVPSLLHGETAKLRKEDDVMWMSGVGDMSHMHWLSKKPKKEKSNGSHPSISSKENQEAPAEKLDPVRDSASILSRDEGEVKPGFVDTEKAGEDRPAKRAKAENAVV